MRNHFVKFLSRKIFLVMVGLFIITGAAVVIIPVNVAHAATVNCPPQIQEGATNTVAVNELHSALHDHYYTNKDLKNDNPYTFSTTTNGAFDGGFGPETRKAVLDYQSQHGLGVDGKVGPQTWGSLLGVACNFDPKTSTTSSNPNTSTASTGSNIPATSTCFPNISEGTSDSATTTDLQNILISKGYSVGSSGPNGQFGPHTKAAVEKFQSDHHLVVNGTVDSQTWKTLGYCNPSGKSGNSYTSCSAGQTLIHGTCYTCKPGTEITNNGQVVACDTSTAKPSTLTISSTAQKYCTDGKNIPLSSLSTDSTVDCSKPSAAAFKACEDGYQGDFFTTYYGNAPDPSGKCADYNKK